MIQVHLLESAHCLLKACEDEIQISAGCVLDVDVWGWNWPRKLAGSNLYIRRTKTSVNTSIIFVQRKYFSNKRSLKIINSEKMRPKLPN
ncbi:unnamed protein product [Allacma fusca]|uniref:Uncharacterized protein n=1 Tax=Allacma fusca TaxID=39272 RepID=A0A8J2JP36_9HEXA|nr:unnamed protein product [Allacma fusca]